MSAACMRSCWATCAATSASARVGSCVTGARPTTWRCGAGEALLKKFGELDFYKGKKLFAALTAGLRALSEDDQTPMLFCLKEPRTMSRTVATFDGLPTV